MSKRASQKLKYFDRLLDSSAVFAGVALVLVAFLVGFYVVLSMSMNTVAVRTEELKEHPYTVTVAAGRTETFLMQIRTLDDRLAFARTPETVESVREEFSAIDIKMQRELDCIVEHDASNPERAADMAQRYEDFRAQQLQLVSLSAGTASDEAVVQFLAENIDPRIDGMLAVNTNIISDASDSFDSIYDSVVNLRSETILTATVLLSVFVAALLLFTIVLMRKNRQQRALRESLSQALQDAQEANAAKSRFLSNVSHDIRTPLTAIIGLTNIASEHTDNRVRLKESLDKIKLSSHHLLNLVNDVLDMSKIESGQIELSRMPFDVCTVVEAMTSIVRAQADVRNQTFIASDCSVNHALVMGDEMRVNQILINLLGNAVKYTEPGGTVTFSARELQPDDHTDVPVQALEGASERRIIRFVVEDNGIGMSPEFVARIFDPFEREEGPARFAVEGTGLGMSIVKSLIDIMEGTIQIKSVRGEGSRVTVDLPFELCTEESADTPEGTAGGTATSKRAPSMHDWSNVRILLVEDNEIVGEIAEELIKNTGASVDRAWDGVEAVDILLTRQDYSYDLVFMDIQMPRMDGLEAARTIVAESARRAHTHPPIIAMTANAYVEDRQRAYDAGMDGYAVKPIGKDDIEHLLEKYVKPKDAE